MRPHGAARISARYPQALAICDRCGKQYNHVDLRFQYDWQGPRMQNLRMLVCDECLDQPFEHNRTIILPPDPMPILNPRPEWYSVDDNPIQALGYDPISRGGFGNMIGINFPFVPPMLKMKSAGAISSPSLAQCYVGRSWTEFNFPMPQVPAELNPLGTVVSLSSAIIQAPTDAPFFPSPTPIEIDGWDGTGWVSAWSGTTAGAVGETINVQLTTPTAYYGHRVMITGDGVNDVAIGGIQFWATGRAVLTVPPAAPPS